MADVMYYGLPVPHRQGGFVVKHSGEYLDPRRDLADLAPGFAWGKPPPLARGDAQLALALAAHALNDGPRALRVYQRLKHRLMLVPGKEWSATEPWSLRASEIIATVLAIEQTEVEHKRIMGEVAKEAPPPPESETGVGVYGSHITWDTDVNGNKIIHKEDE